MNPGWRYPALAITLALVAIFAVVAPGRSGGVPYPRMAQLSQYLIPDVQAEIALARSAAPPSISLGATVLVLTAHGYRTAVTGTNGFTCLVERGWQSPFDDTDFWNPKNRAPVCYNPPASRTVLLYTLRRTDMVLSGLTKSQVYDRVLAAVAAKEWPTPESGSMSYMMSRFQYLGDGVGAWHSHVMFHVPKAENANDGASWGADLPGSPVVFDTSHRVVPEPQTIFMVPVAHWSDGSPAPQMRT